MARQSAANGAFSVNPAEGPAPVPHSLEDVLVTLQKICARNHGTKVSVGDIVQMLGPRSFAPLILTIGLIAVTPIDSIPTMPTTFGVIMFLTVGQMLLGRDSLWLPQIISGRALNADRLGRALARLLPYARWADRWLGVRLTLFTRGTFLTLIALSCAALAALMPMLELVPLVSTIPALAFTAFGIALLLHDGAAALVGFAFTAMTLVLVFELVKLPF
jgi:hypothetical protein